MELTNSATIKHLLRNYGKYTLKPSVALPSCDPEHCMAVVSNYAAQQ
jgi:hypothetical protein